MKNCDLMFSTTSGQSLLLPSSPVVVRGWPFLFAPLRWQRLVRKSVQVRVVDPLSRTTRDNLLEAARISRSAKRNTR